jgi:molybdopterin molybdotransferase
MLSPAEAERLIAERLPLLASERLALGACAGRVLRQAVNAERDQPPFDRVSMDGIALTLAAVQAGRREFRIAGTQAAGAPPLTLTDPEGCLEVMTGAMLPPGTDLVVPVEQLEVHDGVARLAPGVSPQSRQNVHARASDQPRGARLLDSGTLLQGAEVAIAASAGLATVEVGRQPSIMVVSTGDELVEPGAPIADYQIRRSNVYGLLAGLRGRGFTAVNDDHLRDDVAAMTARLRVHLETHDVLILSGGVSAGRFDHVPRVLEDLGVRRVFHQIAQRPGKPMWFGVMDTGRVVFALPGNPVSTLVCLGRYVIPALYRMMGGVAPARERVPIGDAVSFKPALTYFLPIEWRHDASGGRWAMPRPTNGSGDFASLAGTAGFVELPPGPATFPRGHLADLHAW